MRKALLVAAVLSVMAIPALAADVGLIKVSNGAVEIP